MKIVYLERKAVGEDVDVSAFEEFGEYDVYEKTSVDQIEERAKDADVIIMNKLPMNEATIGNLKNLKLILITATGYDNIDVEYCKKRGIEVRNAKGYSTVSVVQHTFASLFYIYEKLNYYDEYVKSGEYVKSPTFNHLGMPFEELDGKVWGIVGLGNIGRGVANVAKSFGCDVIYYSTSGKNNNSDYRRVELDELLETSDIVSIHAPYNDVTKNLFCMDAFKKMKKSAYLINVGRGPIVNESDLVEALNSGEIAGAAIDVLSKEPMTADNPLLKYKDSTKLLVTPHIAWGSLESRTRLINDMYKNMKSYLEGGDFNLITK